jgi:hypothetical protein
MWHRRALWSYLQGNSRPLKIRTTTRFESWQGQEIFLLCQLSRLALGPKQWVPIFVTGGYSGRGVMLTTRLRLAPRLGISRYLPLLPPMPSWRGQRCPTFLPLRCLETSPTNHSLARRHLPDNRDLT